VTPLDRPNAAAEVAFIDRFDELDTNWLAGGLRERQCCAAARAGTSARSRPAEQ